MKAFVIDHYGSNEVVRACEMPDPELRDDDVLVHIHAASVNPLDVKIRDGKLKLILRYRLPLILGNDLAGVVVRVGSRVRRFKTGDEVYAGTETDRIGAFAEFISIKEDAVASKPKKLTMEKAASIPLVGLTAWQVLVERADLKRGQKVLIHAGSGGVGTFAIQLAKHLGAIVATTTSTANLDWVKRLGADIVIDYKKEDFETILHDYDVVFDTLGGATLEKSIRVLKPGGKLISSWVHQIPICERNWTALDIETGNAPFELSNQEKCKKSSRKLFISFHETERRPIAQDRFSHRFRDRSPGCGSGLSIRIDQGCSGLHRKRTCKRQGHRKGEIKMAFQRIPCPTISRWCGMHQGGENERHHSQLRPEPGSR